MNSKGKYCGQQETESGYDYECTLSGPHEEHRAMDTRGNVIKAWPVEPESNTQSGYTHCACRDCMDVAISRDTSKPELCLLCKGAGCLPCFAQEVDRVCGSAHECQRDDAYACDGEGNCGCLD